MRLRNVEKLDEMQMEFMPGRGAVDANFILWQIWEKYNMAGRKLYIVLVDLNKDRPDDRVVNVLAF